MKSEGMAIVERKQDIDEWRKTQAGIMTVKIAGCILDTLALPTQQRVYPVYEMLYGYKPDRRKFCYAQAIPSVPVNNGVPAPGGDKYSPNQQAQASKMFGLFVRQDGWASKGPLGLISEEFYMVWRPWIILRGRNFEWADKCQEPCYDVTIGHVLTVVRHSDLMKLTQYFRMANFYYDKRRNEFNLSITNDRPYC